MISLKKIPDLKSGRESLEKDFREAINALSKEFEDHMHMHNPKIKILLYFNQLPNVSVNGAVLLLYLDDSLNCAAFNIYESCVKTIQFGFFKKDEKKELNNTLWAKSSLDGRSLTFNLTDENSVPSGFSNAMVEFLEKGTITIKPFSSES